MATYINELKEFQLYNRPFYAPINKSNKLKNMASILVTPNYESTKNILNNPNMLVNNTYKAYYTEKSINFLINEKNQLIDESVEEDTDLSGFLEVNNKSGKMIFPVRECADKSKDILVANTHIFNITMGALKMSGLYFLLDTLVYGLKGAAMWQPIYLALSASALINQYYAIDVLGIDKKFRSTYKDGSKISSDYFIYGSKVLACDDGTVITVKSDLPDAFKMGAVEKLIRSIGTQLTGNVVVIKHDDYTYSLYAHLKKGSIKVKPGDKVHAGQYIGNVGNSGNSSEPHLHFELCRFDPSAMTGLGLPFVVSKPLEGFEDHQYIPLGSADNSFVSAFTNMIIDRDEMKFKLSKGSWKTNKSGEINNFCVVKFPNNIPVYESVILEDKLKASERTDFGLPAKKKYPMPDKSHVLAAIRMFNHVDKADEKELASNIKKKIKQYGITDIKVGENNRFYKYYHEAAGTTLYHGSTVRNLEVLKPHKSTHGKNWVYATPFRYVALTNIGRDPYKRDAYIASGTINGRYYIKELRPGALEKAFARVKGTVYTLNDKDFSHKEELCNFELVASKPQYIVAKEEINDVLAELEKYDRDDVIDIIRFEDRFEESSMSPINHLDEDDFFVNESLAATRDMLFVLDEATNYSNIFRKLLYRKRFKNNKEVLNHYDQVKKDIPYIENTYLDLRMYKAYNLFVDFSYYSDILIQNNYLIKDKALNLYFTFLDRFIQDPRLLANGYTDKTVIVDIDDWYVADNSNIWDYTKNINPISMIYRYIRTGNSSLQRYWNGIDFLFLSKNGYFKLRMENLSKKNINKFISLIGRLYEAPVMDTGANQESDESKVSSVVSDIENMSNIKINNLTGSGKKLSNEELQDKLRDAISSDDANKKKEALVDYIKDKVANGEDPLDNNNHTLNKLVADLSINDDDGIKFSATRISRMNSLNDKFLEKEIDGKTVKQIIEKSKINDPVPKTSLPIDSIDDEWDNLTYINFDEAYNPKEDIITILQDLSNKSVPMSVRNLEIEDISTSEDYLDLYKIELEDAYGKRFKLNIEVPRFINNRYMKLRGNTKILSGQLMLLPVIKTDEDTVQVVSNYNKIFIRRYGTTTGKSYPIVDMMIKAINKMERDGYKGIKTVRRNNSRNCSKYQLPIDYIDLASEFDTIENSEYIFYFNQDTIRKKYNISKDEIRIPLWYNKSTKKIGYWNPEINVCDQISAMLFVNDTEREYFNNASKSTKYTYSQASILNTKLPLIVVMAYSEGLQKAMTKANIEFDILDKRERYDKIMYDVIKFNDGYIRYRLNLNSSLLMNGLKECNTEEYSITQINSKAMWVDFLDIFASKIIADGLDNFYDLMIDPITAQTCREYHLPDDYISILAYANQLLVDNKYNKHIDITGNRLRTNEVVAGYFYKAISKAYGDYQRQLKRNKKDATMSCKRSAVIDSILLDPTESDASALNPILDCEAASAVSFKGLSGMNNDRSYGLDKRTYDKSMSGIIALSTGFAANVGLTRWTTIDANVVGERGYIKSTKDTEMTDTKTLCMTEALTPLAVTGDDPFRTAMTFIQTSKHGMRIQKGSPMLVSDGADEAIAYIAGDTFSFKAKDSGKVVELTDDYMIIKYDSINLDTGKPIYEFVDLKERTLKNSDGGFFISVKLDSNVKKGQKIKKGQIVAYDKLAYSNEVGDPDHIAYNIGALAKIAILPTDEGFEDSAIIDSELSEMMASDILVKKEVMLSKNTNVYNMLKPGTEIQEGDPLIIFQNAYDQEDANQLLKTLSADEDEIGELGRITLRAKVSGVVQDIKMYRTVELNELSPSLKKVFTEYERNIKKTKNVMEKYNIDTKQYDSDYKLSTTGKLKNSEDGVLIEFYLKYHDKMSVGDKLIYYAALKGVVKGIFPEGKEPYTDYRPNEKIRSFLTASSVNKRMVTSVIKVGAIQKVLIEMDRKIKDLFDIPWDDNL